MNNLILFGFKGVGKSFWGKKIAEKWGRSFVDTDELMVECTGLSCAEIYKQKGEKTFRELEHERVITLQDRNNCVIALGGGTILYPSNFQILKELGTLVYLKINKETLKRRILNSIFPVYLEAANASDSFEKMYWERLPIYESIPARCVELTESEEFIYHQFKSIFNGE